MSNPTSARAMRRAKARKQAGEIRQGMRREARARRRIIHIPPVGSIFNNLWRRMQRSKPQGEVGPEDG